MFAPPEFPCSTGKNSKIRLFRPSTDQNTMLQVADSIRVRRKFRYAAEQRNFGGLSGELNGRTAELQRNLSVAEIPGGACSSTWRYWSFRQSRAGLQVIDRT